MDSVLRACVPFFDTTINVSIRVVLFGLAAINQRLKQTPDPCPVVRLRAFAGVTNGEQLHDLRRQQHQPASQLSQHPQISVFRP